MTAEVESQARKYKRKQYSRQSDTHFIAALREFLGFGPLFNVPLGQSKERRRQQKLRARHYPKSVAT